MREAINDWLSILLKILIIAAIAAGLIWFGLSVVANVTENVNESNLPKMPALSKADTMLRIGTTGDVLLVKDYKVVQSLENSELKMYILPSGHYEIINDKWRWREQPLTIDEYYWGKINVSRRTE